VYGASANVMQAVDKKIDEVLSRPEVQKEIEAAVEAGIREELPASIQKFVKNSVERYDTPLRKSVEEAVDAWLKAHAEEIRAKVEEAAERVVGETTLFEEVARQQFTHFLSKMAEAAVEKAAAKKGRADKRKGKKAT